MKTWIVFYLLFLSLSANGQGCIPVRNIVGFGQFMRIEYEGYDVEPTKWIVNVNTRYTRIARSYVGTERTNIPPEDERINETFTLNLSMVRLFSHGWSLALDIPFAANARNTWQEHDPSNPDKIHHTVHSYGIGDVRITAYKWLLNIEAPKRGNIALGIGLKFPTGNYRYEDYFYKSTGKISAPVNVTIQPGDGGTGITAELNGYYNLTTRLSLYGDFFYLVNPKDINGVTSIDGGGTPTPIQVQTGDTVVSVPDSYSARAGLNMMVKKFIFWAGARIEGQPTYDFIGESTGTRRAGYTLSFEPGINYTLKKTTLYLFVPITVQRKTQQTVSDIARSKIEGKYYASSGGFADYMVFLGAIFKF